MGEKTVEDAGVNRKLSWAGYLSRIVLVIPFMLVVIVNRLSLLILKRLNLFKSDETESFLDEIEESIIAYTDIYDYESLLDKKSNDKKVYNKCKSKKNFNKGKSKYGNIFKYGNSTVRNISSEAKFTLDKDCMKKRYNSSKRCSKRKKHG